MNETEVLYLLDPLLERYEHDPLFYNFVDAIAAQIRNTQGLSVKDLQDAAYIIIRKAQREGWIDAR